MHFRQIYAEIRQIYANLRQIYAEHRQIYAGPRHTYAYLNKTIDFITKMVRCVYADRKKKLRKQSQIYAGFSPKSGGFTQSRKKLRRIQADLRRIRYKNASQKINLRKIAKTQRAQFKINLRSLR